MSKVILIGIDGMDYQLVKKWLEVLPNIRRIIERGIGCPLESVYPPDSICAWTSIFTGRDPSEHGLLHSIDYLNYSQEKQIDYKPFKGKTFWDIASDHGKRVCIINPFLAYPPWKVNGTMVSGPVFMKGSVKSYPEDIVNNYQVPEIGGIVDFPTQKTLHDFLKRTRTSTKELAEFGKSLYKTEPWDLFFITFLTLDRIKHFLWRYQDPDDPTYPGHNDFSDSVKEFYIFLDGIIGDFLDLADSHSTVMVVSDHGHQRRCYRMVNLNEILRRKGYLQSTIGPLRMLSVKYWIEKLKSSILNAVVRFHLEDVASKIVKVIPNRAALKKSTFVTNFATSVAYTDVEFSGKNPSAGIRLNREIIESEKISYEEVREKVIQEIIALRDPATGEGITQWVKKREEVYSGAFIKRYPDILIQFNTNYGIEFALFGPEFSTSTTHVKISGGHRVEGVLFISDALKNKPSKKWTLLDISAEIQALLGI